MSISAIVNDWSRSDLQRLMSLASVLADLTSSPNLLGQIPGFLARQLDLEPTTLAVLRVGEAVPAFVALALSADNPTTECVEAARRHVLDIYTQNKPLVSGDAPALRESVSKKAIALRHEAGELVLCRAIDANHRLVLVVTHHDTPSEIFMETLDMVGSQLVRLLCPMFAWTTDPAVLGSPFDRLTDREWVVLQGLQSEDGEKQLADRLELSPHTLHSHIKSIYRKLGVQGRLPVLLRLAAAQRALRMRATAERIVPTLADAPQAAIAAG